VGLAWEDCGNPASRGIRMALPHVAQLVEPRVAGSSPAVMQSLATRPVGGGRMQGADAARVTPCGALRVRRH